MSFDMLVFDPSSAPRVPKHFRSWFDKKTEWRDDYDYNEPTNCGADLQRWLLALVGEFPALNGPLAPADDGGSDGKSWADYTIGEDFIYASFPWTQAERAYERTHFLAKECGVGVFDVSEEPAVVTFPDGLTFQLKRKQWWRFW